MKRTLAVKIILVMSLVFAGLILFWESGLPSGNLASSEGVDISLSQLPERGSVKKMVTKKVVSGEALLAGSKSLASSVVNAVPPKKNKELGTWIWESPLQMSPGKVKNLLRQASENGVNAVYITIDDYLSIAMLPGGAEKNQMKISYFEALSRFILQAQTLGIPVDVEGGGKDWVLSTNRWKGQTLIEFVKEYNQHYPNTKIRNFQYDVEPYLLSSYEKDKVGVLQDFVEFIGASVGQMRDVDAGFSLVVPHFYDSAQKWTPDVTYDGNTKNIFSHLLDILERKPGSTVIIMSYRNFFLGDNGIQKISQQEIQEASSGGFHTRVIIAEETGNVDPSYVTFYGHSKQELFGVIADIDNTFSAYASFSGSAVHYIDSFLALSP